MGEYKYHEEEPNIISEELDEKVEEQEDTTIEDDTDEEDAIVNRPINNGDCE